jgi:pimeloyl-ACP methyl ester carboxylesterase
VLAPTLAGHAGGPPLDGEVTAALLPDAVERAMDAAGFETAHIVGNSLGGWVAFELERRGRARTLTGIAPAGGWSHFTPAKFEIVGKFLVGFPVWLTAKALGRRALKLPYVRQIAYVPISASADRLSDEDWLDIIDDVTHCPAYYQLLVKSLLLPGLQELTESGAPTHLVICEKDHVLPHPRFTRHFTEHLPESTQITHLDGVGHIPMFEAPQRIADLIVGFVDRYAPPPRKAIG